MQSDEGNVPNESLDDLLRQREDLDREIQERYQKDVAVMFADLRGSTTFYEQQGDIDKALDIYRKIAQSDFAYKDVSQRVDRLRNEKKKTDSQ